MARVVLALGLALVAAPPTVATAEEPALSPELLLRRLTDPVAALEPLPVGARTVQYSSHDQNGGNGDTVFLNPVAGAATAGNVIRRENGGIVMLEDERPGCLTRMFFTGIVPAQGGLDEFGHLRFFIDGADHPALDVPASQLFTGSVAGFPLPLVGGPDVSSGGNYSYVPICFARSLRVDATLTPTSQVFAYYALQILVLPEGTPVRSGLAPAAAVASAVDALARVGPPPASPAAVRAHVEVGPGRRETVARLPGRGTVSFVRARVEPFTADVLGGLVLEASADGADAPQFAVPLGAAFGDSLEIAPIRAIAFGMDLSTKTGYLALPIPFGDGLTVAIRSTTATATIDLELWRRDDVPVTPYRLHGEQRREQPEVNRDHTVLAAEGSGWLAAWVLDIVGDEGSGAPGSQTFMEGDERVHIDGSRSPSLYGTGTEDAFNGGFYYTNGPFSLPTHGAAPLGARPNLRASQSQYRVFGADAPRWSASIAFGVEHGPGDDRPGRDYTSTTFTYRAPATMGKTDSVGLVAIAEQVRQLVAYFEGDHDGTLASTLATGSNTTPVLPADVSPEGVALGGVEFSAPLQLRFAVDPDNCGVVLRRVLDMMGPAPSRLRVEVGAASVPWTIAVTNRYKRWLEADVELPAAATAGRDRIDVRLVPDGGTENVFGPITAFSRTCAAADGAARRVGATGGPAGRLPATGGVALPAVALLLAALAPVLVRRAARG